MSKTFSSAFGTPSSEIPIPAIVRSVPRDLRIVPMMKCYLNIQLLLKNTKYCPSECLEEMNIWPVNLGD